MILSILSGMYREFPYSYVHMVYLVQMNTESDFSRRQKNRSLCLPSCCISDYSWNLNFSQIQIRSPSDRRQRGWKGPKSVCTLYFLIVQLIPLTNFQFTKTQMKKKDKMVHFIYFLFLWWKTPTVSPYYPLQGLKG